MSKMSFPGSRVLATVLATAMIGVSAAPLAQAQTRNLTTEERTQESALVQKALDAVRALPPNSSAGAFEGALFEAAEGFSATVVAAAMNQIAGTPGLPANAQAAARRVARVYENATNSAGSGQNAFGFNGTLPGLGAPGFASGGGGGASYQR